MVTACYLDANEKDKQVVQSKYIGMIKSLLYLTINHPNIVHRNLTWIIAKNLQLWSLYVTWMLMNKVNH